MSQQPKKNDEADDHVKRALEAADALATAVLRGSPGQQKLALDFARAKCAAVRAGYDLTKRA